MGTYYSVGIVKEFAARAANAIDAQTLERVVGERFDLGLFDTDFQNGCLTGMLKPGLFNEHIADFVEKLVNIAPDSRETILYYLEKYGADIDRFPSENCKFVVHDAGKKRIDIRASLSLLFIEGKVLVEQFSIEPALLNWLFRHSDFGNPLAGAVLSDITR